MEKVKPIKKAMVYSVTGDYYQIERVITSAKKVFPKIDKLLVPVINDNMETVNEVAHTMKNIQVRSIYFYTQPILFKYNRIDIIKKLLDKSDLIILIYNPGHLEAPFIHFILSFAKKRNMLLWEAFTNKR